MHKILFPRIHIHNSLNVTKFNTPIYRFISFESLCDILISKIMPIWQVTGWDDVYENFLTKAEHYWGSNRVPYGHFASMFYGQSWTLHRETDALWRIYSVNKEGVRIKSNIVKILNSLKDKEVNKDELFSIGTIGKVDYKNIIQINKWINTNKLINIDTLRNSLFIKRKEFSHEKEVRLIIQKYNQDENNKQIECNFIGFNIDPNFLFEEVTFDPRLPLNKFDSRKKILQKLGFVNPIFRSKLYDFKLPRIVKY